MARQAKFDVTIDSLAVDGMAAALEGIGPRDFGVVAMASVNQVAAVTRDNAKRAILSGINLTEPYVDERLRLDEAVDPAKPIATIASPKRNTTLASYNALQLVQSVRWTNDWIAANKKPIGKWPKWTPRVGRPNVGIAPDQKAAGVSVEVLKGTPKSISYAFVIRKGGKPIVLKRTRDDKLIGAQAPAVYQMFRHALDPEFLARVAEDLEKFTLQNVSSKLLKGLT